MCAKLLPPSPCPPPQGWTHRGFLCDLIMAPPQNLQLFLCASQRLQQGSHRPAEAEGAALYSVKSSYALLMFYSLSAMCSCVRLCFFTTRLHCQSASLIGCEDNNTVIFTLTLQSSRNRRGEKREAGALWTFNIINTPKTNQANTEKKKLKKSLTSVTMSWLRGFMKGKKDTLWWENRARVWAYERCFQTRAKMLQWSFWYMAQRTFTRLFWDGELYCSEAENTYKSINIPCVGMCVTTKHLKLFLDRPQQRSTQ